MYKFFALSVVETPETPIAMPERISCRGISLLGIGESKEKKIVSVEVTMKEAQEFSQYAAIGIASSGRYRETYCGPSSLMLSLASH